MDKLNKTIIILIVLSIIAFLFGSFFITILNNTDQTFVKEYMTSYLNDIFNNKINYSNVLIEALKSNLSLIIIIFLLSISIIGIPIIIFIYFFKVFSIGFSISSFILTYKFKGLIFSLIYIFPSEIIKYLVLSILVFNSINISKKIIKALLKKEGIYLNKMFGKLLKIYIFVLITIILVSIYETFAVPFIFNKLYFLVK